MNQPQLLLGDEAIALAAIHAGLSGAYGYPGTPSTEILEFILPQAEKYNIKGGWATNEKVALELAIGHAFAGKKSIVTMKHVGLNVAMDPFMSVALTGVSGGLLAVVADDPGMHSSQNEQDSRVLAKFANMPCFEPSNQQECYDLTRDAYVLSEQLQMPFMMRLVTRLAHSRSKVFPQPANPQNSTLVNIQEKKQSYTLLPVNARRQYKKLIEAQPAFKKLSEKYNTLNLSATDKSVGFILSGVAYNYMAECFDGKIPFPYLKVNMYPISPDQLTTLFNDVNEIFVFEDGYPVIEEMISGLSAFQNKKIKGKLTGNVPYAGELDPDVVAQCLNIYQKQANQPTFEQLPSRPPALCKGCPHCDSYNAITHVLNTYNGKGAIFGDIGCYTLAFYQPFNGVHACIEMGGSIGMGIGASQAGTFPVMCTIGDGTFTHSGITCLITAVKQKANINVFILDNDITAMTGGQESSIVGENIIQLVKGCGVDEKHIRILNPLPRSHPDNVKAIEEEVAFDGVSVMVFRRACIQKKK